MIFLTFLLIPVIIAACLFVTYHKKIKWQEFLCHVLLQVLVAGISLAIICGANVWDTETWNGWVTHKKSEKVHCRHSYPCNPHPCMCDDDGCSTCWDTCYSHNYDMDWKVYANIGSWTIDTVDSQGLKEPPRWTVVQINDPVVQNRTFENYIKGAPNTLFRQQGLVDQYKTFLPNHPHTIYDYYKINRVLTVGDVDVDTQTWNDALTKLNSVVGYQKGCNIILVLTKNQPREYFHALSQYWLGGKKNDIIVVVNLTANTIEWVDVMAWTTQELFKVKLRDDILNLKQIDTNHIMQVLETDIRQYYIRQSMSEFAYLRASITPTPTQWIFAMMFGFMVSIGAGIFFIKNDVF